LRLVRHANVVKRGRSRIVDQRATNLQQNANPTANDNDNWKKQDKNKNVQGALQRFADGGSVFTQAADPGLA
jgi:hypothetical protein